MTIKQPFIFTFLTLLSLQTFASDSISVRVSTNEKAAAAIGFSVADKKSGGMGKSYAGTGPRNQVYQFGYRKSVFGRNIPCGNQRLRQSSSVFLITKNNSCRSMVRKMGR